MKVGFVSCVQLGLSCIEAIYEAGGKVDFIVTLPDEKARKKSGRVYFDEFATTRQIELFKAPHINEAETIRYLEAHKPDLLFVIGWSQIASEEVIRSAGYAIGAHPTLLPIGRGRAAIPWAIIKGLRETGVSLFLLESGVDTGAVIAQKRLSIAERETATTLYQRVADAHAEVIAENWPALSRLEINAIPQDESLATVWPGRRPADGELFPEMTVIEADRLVRATTHPYPGAFIRQPDGSFLRVWRGQPVLPGWQADGAMLIRFSDGLYVAEDFELTDAISVS